MNDGNARNALAFRAVGIAATLALVALALMDIPSASKVAGVVSLALLALALCPEIGLFFFFCGYGLSWFAPFVGVDQTSLFMASGAALVVSALVLCLNRTARATVRYPIVLVGVAVVASAIVAWGQIPSSNIVGGVRALCLPVFALWIGSRLSSRALAAFARFLTILMVVSVAIAAWQVAAGTEALLARGLEFGRDVRTTSGSLRASGTFATNYEAGAFAAVLLLCAWFWGRNEREFALPRRWIFTAVVASASMLVLANFRTGVLMVGVGMLVAFFSGRREMGTGARLLAVVLASAIVVFYFELGYATADSLHARLVLWTDVLFGDMPILGHGLGSAGSASIGSGGIRVVTDNYYLNIWYQMGVIAFLPLAAFGWLCLVSWRADRQSFAILAGILAAGFMVEIWEYQPAMILALVFVGSRMFRSDSLKEVERALGTDRKYLVSS